MTDPSLISHPRDSIRKMTERLLSGHMSSEEFEHFQEILLHDPAARLVYIEHINVHAELSYLGGAVAQLEDRFQSPVTPRSSSLSWISQLATTMACCLVVGLALYLLMNTKERVRDLPVLGTFSFEEEESPLVQHPVRQSSPKPIRQGQLYSIPPGITYFQLQDGIKGSLQGPAQLRFKDTTTVQLDFGVIVATVAPQALGFRVMTPHADLLDLGTTFSVSAFKESKLEVFDGQVSARHKAPDTSAYRPVIVQAGQSAQVVPRQPIVVSATLSDSGPIFESLKRLYGIRSLSETIRVLPAAPPSVDSQKLTSDTHIFLINEKQSVRLQKELLVAPPISRQYVSPGTYQPITLASGTDCSCVLLHCDFVNRTVPISGTVRFDRPILGLIFESGELQRSDEVFSARGTQYPDEHSVFVQGQSRGCVVPFGGKGELQDVIQVHDDGHGLDVTLYAPEFNIDQVRVLLRSPDF